MTEGKKVLILYITERSGHHSAALSIKKALLSRDPSSSVHCVNAFRYAFPFAERITHALYLAVIKRVPKIWETMYDNPKLIKRSQLIKNWIHVFGMRRIKCLIHHFNPDVVICTQAFPCGLVADYKKFLDPLSRLPLIGVLTDFAPHAYWVYDDVDFYVVGADESRDMLVDRGVPKQKIKVLGIPIDPKFSANPDRKEMLSNYGLKEDLPVLMVMGGGHGLGPIKDILYELECSEHSFQLIVVCGLNKKLYRWIQRAKFKNRVLSFCFTDQVDRLMSVSDLIITKPGGITTAEALAKKLPMVILNPIPGQESRNTDFLINKGAAVKIEKPSEIIAAVNQLLKTEASRKGFFGLFDGIHSLSRPTSSLDIAQLALTI